MVGMTSQTVDTGVVAMGDNVFQDAYIKFAAAGTLKAGTILARDTSATGDILVLVPYQSGVAGATGIAAVLNSDVSATAAGNVLHRALISGKVRFNRLSVISGDPVSIENREDLRVFGIIAVDVNQLSSVLDNQ